MKNFLILTGCFIFLLGCSKKEEPPVACFNYNANGAMYTFNSSCSEHATSWVWDFGDGESSASPNPTHVYGNPGYYTVQLTVKNEDGSSTTSKPADVQEFCNTCRCGTVYQEFCGTKQVTDEFCINCNALTNCFCY